MKNNDKTMKRLEMEMAIKAMTDNLDLLFQSLTLSAKANHTYFLSLQDAGFTQEQALEIVKAHKTPLG